jgi:lipopolysaccharide transport system ATP-binding protein
LRLKIACNEPDLIPNVGFQIRDRFGNIACGTNTSMLRQEMPPQAAGVVFQITFGIQLMIGSGEYTITVAVSSSGSEPDRIYDWIDQLAHFVVVPHKSAWVDGLAYSPVTVISSAVHDEA